MISVQSNPKPYITVPGVPIVVPGSRLYCQVYPTCVRVFSQRGDLLEEYPLDIDPPLRRFGVFQDLIRGGLRVITEQYKFFILPSGEKSHSSRSLLPPHTWRLSLGVNKQPNWFFVHQRLDLNEMLPLWMYLSRLCPGTKEAEDEELCPGGQEMLGLLQDVEQCIASKDRIQLDAALLRLLVAGFAFPCFPRRYDDTLLGITQERGDNRGAFFTLLYRCYSVFEGMFMRQQDREIHILPVLPTKCVCGRIVELPILGVGSLAIEWTKRAVRRVVLHADRATEVSLFFPKYVREVRCRELVRGNPIGRGKVFGSSTVVLETDANRRYLFDQLQ